MPATNNQDNLQDVNSFLLKESMTAY